MTEHGYGCEEKPLDYLIVVGIPLIVVGILIVILIVIIIIIFFITQQYKRKKKLEMTVSIFEYNKSNITMTTIGKNIVGNYDSLDFNEDADELPVDDETKQLMCVGVSSGGRTKIQLTTKADNYRYQIRVDPSVVTLKKGQACEFSIYLKPMCTCEVNDNIVINVCDMATSEENQIQLPFKFKTEVFLSLRTEHSEKSHL